MKSPRGDVGRIRREEIVEAAVAVIAEQGLQNLSLSAIEKRAGMSRGQLTYYFPTKESILLAVFDRMLRRMIDQAMRSDGPKPMTGRAWDCVRYGLGRHLEPARPSPAERDFFSLVHTFLAQ